MGGGGEGNVTHPLNVRPSLHIYVVIQMMFRMRFLQPSLSLIGLFQGWFRRWELHYILGGWSSSCPCAAIPAQGSFAAQGPELALSGPYHCYVQRYTINWTSLHRTPFFATQRRHPFLRQDVYIILVLVLLLSLLFQMFQLSLNQARNSKSLFCPNLESKLMLLLRMLSVHTKFMFKRYLFIVS